MNLLKDNSVQNELNSSGFVKLKLSDSKIIASLKSLVDQSIEDKISNSSYSNYALFASLHQLPIEKARQIEQEIEEILKVEISNMFNNVKFHFGNILIKASSKKSYTFPHQDWTFVDHHEAQAVTVWIPLQATNVDNGTLGFMKGSHKYLNKLVGSPVRQFYSNCTNYFQLFYSLCDFISVDLGEILIFDGRTVHSAVPNITGKDRVAISFSLTPAHSQIYHHIVTSKDLINRTITRIKVDRNFFSYYTVEKASELYELDKLPEGYEIDQIFQEQYVFHHQKFIEEMIKKENLVNNGLKIEGF